MDTILADLRSKDGARRETGLEAMRIYLDEASRSLGPEEFERVYADINTAAQRLIGSPAADPASRLAGLYVVEAMLAVLGADASRTPRLALGVWRLLPSTDARVMAQAAVVLGLLAGEHAGGAGPYGSVSAAPSGMAAQIDSQLRSCIEWLQEDRVETKRYAAVLVARELTKHIPGIVYDYVPELLDNLWTALGDPKPAIREAAAGALNGCLAIAAAREGQFRRDAYAMVLEQAEKGLASDNVSRIHGSLLGLKNLYYREAWTEGSKLDAVTERILKFVRHKDTLIRQTVIDLVPTLAASNPTRFAQLHLNGAMDFLVAQLSTDRAAQLTKSLAFFAVGQVALVMKAAIVPFLAGVLHSVHNVIEKGAPAESTLLLANDADLEQKSPLALAHLCGGLDDAALASVSMLARAAGPAITAHIYTLLNDMFAHRMTIPLVSALSDLGTHVPPILPVIQYRLLDRISIMLSGVSWEEPGSEALRPAGHANQAALYTALTAAAELGADTKDIMGASPALNGALGVPHWPALRKKTIVDVLVRYPKSEIITTLKTLATFRFEGHRLASFARHVVVHFIDADDPDIRRTTVAACANIIADDGVLLETATDAISLVSDVVEKLLQTAAADADSSIRQAALDALDARFDAHLSHASCIRILFATLNDESFPVRLSAAKIIARLSLLNPANIMPSLRKTLVQLMTELHYATGQLAKRDATTLLGVLAGMSPALARPYVAPMLDDLLTLARDPSPAVSHAALVALGQVCRVGGHLVLPQKDKIMYIVIDVLSGVNLSSAAAPSTSTAAAAAAAAASDQQKDQPAPSQASSSSSSNFLVPLAALASEQVEAALTIVGHLASYAAYVIAPFIDYPPLQPILINLLRTDHSVSIRRQAVKLLGSLGALDPYKQSNLLLRRLNSSGDDSISNAETTAAAAAAVPLENLAQAAAAHVAATGHVDPHAAPTVSALQDNPTDPMHPTNIGPSHVDYYPTVAFSLLLQILVDPTISEHHAPVVQAVMYIFRSLRLRVVQFIPQVIAALVAIVRTCPASLQEFYLQELAQLISMVKQYIRNHLSPIVQVINDLWPHASPPLRVVILDLIHSMARALESEFKLYLPAILPLLVSVLPGGYLQSTVRRTSPSSSASAAAAAAAEASAEANSASTSKRSSLLASFRSVTKQADDSQSPTSNNHASSSSAALAAAAAANSQSQNGPHPPPIPDHALSRVLTLFVALDASLEEYLHLILGPILNTVERSDFPTTVRVQALRTLAHLCQRMSFVDYASRIIHVLLRVLKANTPGPNNPISTAALDMICTLIMQLGPDFLIFVPAVKQTLASTPDYPPLTHLVNALIRNEPLPTDSRFLVDASNLLPAVNEPAVAADAGVHKLPVNQVNLRSAWEQVEHPTSDDWKEWMMRMCVQFLKSSPSHSLRACAGLAEAYHPLARDLFNAAFVSCWSELYDPYKEELVQTLSDALASPTVPSEVTHMILNLAEFMEHDDKVLPIPTATLGFHAQRSRAFTKALHYKELEFLEDPSPDTIESLIRINNHLQQPDVSVGILTSALKVHHVELKEEWYIELERWDDALIAFERKQLDQPDNVDVAFGRMRCLHALGEWDALADLASEFWSRASSDMRRRMAPLAAAAAWGLGQWESMDSYILSMRSDSLDRYWYRSVLAIHRNQFTKAQREINRTRDILDQDLSALMGESYARAYDALVRAQMLSELEEVAAYKQAVASDDIEGRAIIQKAWMGRIAGCKRDVEVWQRILTVRGMVISPADSLDMWIKFANMCRKSGRLGLAEKILNSLLNADEGSASASSSLAKSSSLPSIASSSFPKRGAAANSSVQNSLPNGSGGGVGGDHSRGTRAPSTTVSGPPQVIYAHLKFLWAAYPSARPDTLSYMRDFTARLAFDLGLQPDASQLASTELARAGKLHDYMHLLARCYYKLGEWQSLLQEGAKHKSLHEDPLPMLASSVSSTGSSAHSTPSTASSATTSATTTTEPPVSTEILQSYQFATTLDRKWYKAWHAFALANAELVAAGAGVPVSEPQPALRDRDRTPPKDDPFQAEEADAPAAQAHSAPISVYLIPAIHAFFQSIQFSPGESLQDTLRLLTLWFRYGDSAQVTAAVMDGFSSVSIDTWLEVIPQLIARIHAPSTRVRHMVQRILTDIGRAHPQALIYSLTVASKYPSAARRKSALHIMDRMRDHSATLVDQALLVSQELIRVAILWHEMWHEGLEEASRQYYGDGNIQGMFATLDPLHDMVERGGDTIREINFVQSFGHELGHARELCRQYKQFGDLALLIQAWETYYNVFRKISKMLSTMTVLELQHVSPGLMAVHNLQLAVPGSYVAHKPIIRIQSFFPTCQVFTSKQRPRKIHIRGSDGKEYDFLLKGHEDLRQDERVMQLFGLCNTLLQKDAETFKRHLIIVKYPVIPLSANSGLLGWVNSTDTLHVLIKNYRESRRIVLNIEHRLILEFAPDFDCLCILQKLEVFEHALEHTTGQDFYRVLWLKSRNSESWLERRAEYERTLAVMSMVGFILGLGDRHPSNLLMDRVSGRIIHVDFGDCFDVAMMREKHPEKVPFRLTRMLVKAFEVSGIEGTFKITSQNTMRVLRTNKESIIAVLEAFVHDPLINWRLVQREQPQAMDDNADYLNTRAIQVVDRVNQKLTGRDFKPSLVLSVNDQVDKLIEQATSYENLSQCFIGWCPFW